MITNPNNSQSHSLNYAICVNNPLAVIENLRNMGVAYDGDPNNADAVLNAVYALDHKGLDCTEFTNKILVPALDVPVLPEGGMAKELIEFAVDSLPALVMLESECYSGKTMLVSPDEYNRMKLWAYIGLGFVIVAIVLILIKLAKSILQ